MKIDLIIKDATPAQAASIFQILGATTAANMTVQPSYNIGGAVDAETIAKLASMNGHNPGVFNIPHTNGVQPMTAPPGTNNPGNAGNSTNADEDNAPNTNAPAVDAAGLPHDVRIHSDNKGLTKDGTWRKRRGAQDVMIAAVEAELRMRVNGAPQFTPPTSAMPMPSAPQFTPPQYQQPVQMQPPAPQFTPPMPDQQYQQPQFTQPVQMQPPAAAMDFNGFMQHLGGQMQKRDAGGNPLINTDYLASIAQRLTAHFQRQFNSITDIGNDPNVINVAVAFINGDGRWN